MPDMLTRVREALDKLRGFAYGRPEPPPQLRIGLALGGGFARGIAHIGVLRVLEQNNIPIHAISGTSVGALIAAAYACGSPLEAMEEQAKATQFKDFARWTLSWLGLASNERLEHYLHRFCAANRFEEMKTPLAIVATDLGTGEPVHFTRGPLGPPLRASCAYPGLFLPVEHEGRVLVDGFVADPVPVQAVRALGANYVIAVYLEPAQPGGKPKNVADIVSRSFSILLKRTHHSWRRHADAVIEPKVSQFEWDSFVRTPELIAAGEAAARAALPKIREALAVSPGVPPLARADA